jgi:putative intracellular protease/amidase
MKTIIALILTLTSLTSFANSKGKVLFILTNEDRLSNGAPSGIHFNELTHPYHAFRSAGYEVEFASPKGGNAPVDMATLEQQDPMNRRFWTNPALRSAIARTPAVGQLLERKYSAIFVVGGVSTMYDFPISEELQVLIKNNYEKGSVIGAVCHGPAALVNIKLSNGKFLVEGRNISSFTNEEEIARKREKILPFALETVLKQRGARFTKADNFKYHVVSDGKLITGQNPASAFGVAHEMINVLNRNR